MDNNPPPLIKPDWPASNRVLAFTTTRAGGVSHGAYDSLNLGARCGDSEAAVKHNRQIVTQLLPENRPPLWLNQIHGTRIYDSGSRPATMPSADASICRSGQYSCAVLTADCLPVLLCADSEMAVAAAHAGWRGLHQGVIEETVAAMDVAPEGLMAWLGPAISQSAFEVGPEVRAAFITKHPELARAFRPGRGDRWYGDLYAIARETLIHAGVTRIYGGELCTYGDARFYSYRRDGRTGRMVSVITRLP